jgi:hypothetical protein
MDNAIEPKSKNADTNNATKAVAPPDSDFTSIFIAGTA